ncbi:helix-turn-helix transcriptional regulator [Streptomyces sp. CHD11]|uniref:helix-turn-helix domain-containing protein n=1 Tax=Streptomyces sp. CHD11 TaxID=2741325 RepID=UPI001BFC4774|nr:helix-turn-helix transcriptional regulator [Streptomyces sp. CHD11]MBT3155086.1 helix-turn-helix transcriptional regulator [Streptomyces sp. CHD11]
MWTVDRPAARTDRRPPPLNAPVAFRLRAALGLGPEQVAHTLRVSYGLPYVTPALVAAWERGSAAPSHPELVALAGVLWCSPGELIGRPRTLREHRVARGLAPEDVARTVGHELQAYLRMEETDRWRGSERQSAALARLLGLSLADVITVTGREDRLAEMLRGAVTTRWQAYVRPVSGIVPLERRRLEEALHRLHRDYRGQMAATLSRGGGHGDAGDSGREFLERIVEHFWTTVGEQGR